jgi:hypothetical protein
MLLPLWRDMVVVTSCAYRIACIISRFNEFGATMRNQSARMQRSLYIKNINAQCASMKQRHIITSPLLLCLLPLITPTFIDSPAIAQAAFSSYSIRTINHYQSIVSSIAMMSSSNNILESPSAERNKGPIYDMVLSPIVLPRLLNDDTTTTTAAADNNKKSLKVLELAAGCGVHTIHFTQSILSSHPSLNLEWIPSDPDEEARQSIDARVCANANLSSCVQHANGWILGNRGGTACQDGIRDKGDAGSSSAGMSSSSSEGNGVDYEMYTSYFDLLLCINMIHIAPWEATLGLMECAGVILRSGGILMCYGPYKVDGTAVESNL